jgi:hypothetical protein
VVTVLRRFETGGITDGCGEVDDVKRCYGGGGDDDGELRICRQQMTMCLNMIILRQ